MSYNLLIPLHAAYITDVACDNIIAGFSKNDAIALALQAEISFKHSFDIEIIDQSVSKCVEICINREKFAGYNRKYIEESVKDAREHFCKLLEAYDLTSIPCKIIAQLLVIPTAKLAAHYNSSGLFFGKESVFEVFASVVEELESKSCSRN